MVQIRLATREDQLIIAGFQIKMAHETEGLQLDKSTVNTGVEAVFRNPGKGKYYVAEEEGTILASLLITFEWSDWRNKWVYWIQSVYVIPTYRKQGVFKTMYAYIQAGVQKDENVAGLRLYVDKTNLRAIKVYQNIGMDGEHYRFFEWMKS